MQINIDQYEAAIKFVAERNPAAGISGYGDPEGWAKNRLDSLLRMACMDTDHHTFRTAGFTVIYYENRDGNGTAEIAVDPSLGKTEYKYKEF